MDIRYHLTSLIAVFFALGIGLVIGMSLAEDGAFREEQGALIRSIENQLGSLRSENARLQAQLAVVRDQLIHYDGFMEEAAEWLLEEALHGKHITVLASRASEEAVRELTAFLGTHGAVVSHITWLSEQAGEGRLQRIGGLIGSEAEGTVLVTRLAEALLGLDSGQGLAALAANNMVAYDIAGHAPDSVVIVADESLPNTAELAQAVARLQRAGVVIAPPSAANDQWFAPFAASGWAQSGAIDALPGRIRTAWLIKSMVHGDEGHGWDGVTP